MVHLFLGIVFIAVLVAILRAALGPEPAVYMALLGGAVFIALTAAGLAAEVAIPAVIARFGETVSVEVFRPYLALSAWLYHYSQIGSAVLMFATSYAIWRTEVLPKWTAALGVLGSWRWRTPGSDFPRPMARSRGWASWVWFSSRLLPRSPCPRPG